MNLLEVILALQVDSLHNSLEDIQVETPICCLVDHLNLSFYFQFSMKFSDVLLTGHF